jgi:hydrogenase nickel insertion protein HypA
MHELSLAHALVDEVERIQVQENAEAVLAITVEIGALSGVDRSSFEFAFPLAVEGSALAAALLTIEETPTDVTCGDGGAVDATGDRRCAFVYPKPGHLQFRLVPLSGAVSHWRSLPMPMECRHASVARAALNLGSLCAGWPRRYRDAERRSFPWA